MLVFAGDDAGLIVDYYFCGAADVGCDNWFAGELRFDKCNRHAFVFGCGKNDVADADKGCGIDPAENFGVGGCGSLERFD